MSDDESNRSRRRWRGSDDESSHGELEDEDDYDSEEEEECRPNKKRKTNKSHHGFVIEEAEVDDDMDDEEEWDGSTQEIGIDINEADEVGPTAREIEGRQRGRNLFENRREDEIEDYFRRKYASNPESGLNEQFGEGEEMSDEIFQQTLLPCVKDPNLWLVKCRIGEEKSTALLLMRKFLTYERTDRILQIKSVIAPEGAKGFIYVEAYKQVNVKEAIENVGNLKAGYWNQQMVPIKEMTDVLDVRKEQINLVHKQWVRPKRGTYKDDIAQVDFVEVAQNKVILKLVPRIDYTKKRGALRALDDDDDLDNEDDEPSRTKRRKRMTSKNRPPPKLFDAEAIKELGGEITPDGDFMMFENNRYSTKGFLYKSFNIKSIISGGVKPTLSELEMFEDNPEESHFEMPGNENIIEHNFCPGDNVEVCQGELTGLTGRILSVEGKRIVVMPFHDSLTEALEFPANELQKCFEVGNHVKIIDGKHEGDTGFVIRAEQNRLIIFSDLSMHEIDIFSRYVQLCPDVTTGVDSVGQFQFGDLVSVDSQTVGVIVRLERDLFHVLTMHGKIQEMKPQGLSRVPNYAKASALDAQQNTINRNDAVQVIDGPHSGRNGKIKYLYRYFAFIQAQNHVDNGGIIVCKTRHIQLQGNSRVSISYPAVITFKPPKPTSSPMITASPIHTTVTAGNSTPVVDFGRSGVGGSRATRQHRDIIGSTVKIIRGPYKGSVGYCKDATESTVRVELTSSYQTVTFSRANVQNMEPKVDSYQNSQRAVNQSSGSQTPMYRPAGSKTPMYEVGSRTPHYGSATPSSLDGSRTPQSSAWDPSITNTPARPNDFDDFGGEDGASPASFTRGYDPSVAPYTPQITDSEDWDADSNTASPTARRAKVATPPTRRGPLVREGRPKTFNRPARDTAPIANRKLGDENWDDEDDEQPRRFDPRANEKPPVEDFGRFQRRPPKKWGNDGNAPVANTSFRPGNSQFGNRRNDVPRASGGLETTENWDDEDDSFNNTPQIPVTSQFESKSTENWDDEDNFATPIPPRVPSNSRFENKRNDVPQPVGGLGSTENWDEEDNFNASEVPSTPHVPPNSRFDNKRNDVPRGGLNNTENWDEEENCSTPANPRPPHVSARPKFENKRSNFRPASRGLDSTENWDEEDDFPAASNTPRGPVNPRFENKRNDVPRAVGGLGRTENWNEEHNYTAPTPPHMPANPRFGNKRNDVPRAVGGLGSTENWDDEDNFAAPIAPIAPRVPANSRFENKRNDIPRPVGGLGSTENWDEEDNFTPPAAPSTPYVPATPRFENKRNDVPRPAAGLNTTENWDEEAEFAAPVASSTPRLPVAPRFENQRNNFSRPARGRGNKRSWNNNNNNNNFSSPDANSFSRLPKIPKFANKRNDAPNIVGGLDSSENWDDDEDAPVNCPSLPSSTNTFSYENSPAHKVEYSEPVNSFTNTTKTTDEYAWITPDLEVNVNDSFEDWDFAGQNAVVNSVSGNMCNVTVKVTNQTGNVPCNEITPLIPEVNERVKIIKGEFCNEVGTFESLVDNGGVVRTDSGESQVVSLDYLCKTRQ